MVKSDELKQEINNLKNALSEIQDAKQYYYKMLSTLESSESEIEERIKLRNKELKQALKDEMPQEEILIKKIASIKQLLEQNKYTIQRQVDRIENSKINLTKSRDKLRAKQEHRDQLEKALYEAEYELRQVQND